MLSDDDDDEGATELPEQKQPTSTRVEGATILDDYFNCSGSEDHEAALLQLVVKYESPPETVETSSTIQDAGASISPGDLSSEPNSSDEELLTSYLESKNKDITSEHYSVSLIKTEKTDFNTAYSTSLQDVVHGGGDVMNHDNESGDFASLETRTLSTRARTSPVPAIQRATVSNSSGKADLSSDSDEEALSVAASRRALESTNVKTLTKVKSEEILSESETPSFDEAFNTTSRDTSTHKSDFPQIETEIECNNSLFAEANEITYEVDHSMDGNSEAEGENYEVEIGGRGGTAQSTVQTIKHEPAEEGEDRLSLSSISRQFENKHFIDDGINLWDENYGYSKHVVNSQENALARIEEDLDDLYSTQIENVQENDTIMSSPYASDTTAPDEALSKTKPQKHVTFADESNSSDTVASPRPSVSQPAITKPTRALSEDELFRTILNWKAERLCRLQSNGRPASRPCDIEINRVPSYFDSMDQYYNTFKPLLFTEFWEQVFSKFVCFVSHITFRKQSMRSVSRPQSAFLMRGRCH